MILLLTVVVILFTGVISFFKLKYTYWEKRKVPYLKPTFLFGNVSEVILLKKRLSDVCMQICRKFENTPFVGFFLFWTPSIIVRDHELIKSILIKNFNHFEDHFVKVEPEVDTVLANNPICLKGEAWKKVRTNLTPQFTVAKLKSVIPLTQKVGNDLVKFINAKIDSCFNVKDLTARYTGECVFMVGFGLEGQSFVDEVPLAMKIGEDISGSGKFLHFKQLIGMFFPMLRRLLKFSVVGSTIPKSFRDLILNAIEYRTSNNIVRTDYLNYISKLKSGDKGISEDEILGHAYTLYVNGFETTSIAITHMLYELSLNPVVQQKCREEVTAVLNKYNGKLAHEALMELEYISATIFETLRKHSPIAALFRLCTKDFEVTFCNHLNEQVTTTIEKGTVVVIPPEIIHHDPKYYPDPEVFSPERFLTDSQSNSFLGFGEGPRGCLGRNFAVLVIKVFMVSVLSKYSITMNEKTIIPYKTEVLHLFNVPKDGIYIDFFKLEEN